MFFLRDHLRIKRISYAFCDSTDAVKVSEFTETLLEIQTLVGYFYSSPHPTFGDPFLNYEHSSLYILRPKEVFDSLIRNHQELVEELPEIQNIKFNSRNEVDGYEGILNNKSYFWVTEGSRIFPPSPHLGLNLAQDLSAEFKYHFPHSDSYGAVLNYFISKNEKDNLSKRILTALAWHNKSVRQDIDESEALVNLAIAFESLLDLERDKDLTVRFKEAISLLVGDVSRLDSWITQFYEARSDIVHKGQSRHLMFIPTDDPKKDIGKSELEYRSLVSYGRQIFRVCVATILTGAKLANKLNLPSLLISNQERFERICRTLADKNGSPTERILATSQDVIDIENYRFVPEKGLMIEQLIGTAKLIVKQYLDTNPNDDGELVKQMQSLVTTDTKNHYEALGLINAIQEQARVKSSTETVEPDPHNIVTTLLSSIWGYAFMYFYHLQDKKRQETDKSS